MAKAAADATAKPKKKAPPKKTLSANERHKRFVDMARTVEADESPEAFNRAFEKIVQRSAPPKFDDK
ncbi:MAG TPA: hypothetical protein VEK34_12290 [Methylocella sp.]|nr:hypothetical protein [Methylocella sp.]